MLLTSNASFERNCDTTRPKRNGRSAQCLGSAKKKAAIFLGRSRNHERSEPPRANTTRARRCLSARARGQAPGEILLHFGAACSGLGRNLGTARIGRCKDDSGQLRSSDIPRRRTTEGKEEGRSPIMSAAAKPKVEDARIHRQEGISDKVRFNF